MKGNAFAKMAIKIKSYFCSNRIKTEKPKVKICQSSFYSRDHTGGHTCVKTSFTHYSNYAEQEKYKQKLEEIKTKQAQYRLFQSPF